MAKEDKDKEGKKKNKEEKKKKDKGKKRPREELEEQGAGADEVKSRVSPIASPMASKKLTKSLLKLVKQASEAKHVRRGVKEVVKALKKDEMGLCIIAGDISPIDVICHIPIFCEDKGVAYIYVSSKEELGLASQTKRPTSIVMVKAVDGAEYKDEYEACVREVQSCTPAFT